MLLTSVESFVVLSLYYEGSICMCTPSLCYGFACDGKALTVMAQAAKGTNHCILTQTLCSTNGVIYI